MNRPIHRVRSFGIKGFRGFARKVDLDLDADLVLLLGANGTGKTSLIDALCMVLNHHHYVGRLSDDLERRERPLFTMDGDRARLAAEVTLVDGTEETVTMELHRGEGTEALASHWRGGKPRSLDMNGDLAARLTCLYADRWFELFDETSGAASTLGQLFDPAPENLLDFVKEAVEVRDRLADRIERERRLLSVPPPENSQQPLLEASRSFAGAWGELRGFLDGAPTLLEPPDGARAEAALVTFARDVLAGAGRGMSRGRLREALEKALDQALKEVDLRLRRGATTDPERALAIADRIEGLRRQEAALHVRFPALDQELSLFNAPNDGVDLLAVFEALSKDAGRWAQALLSAGEQVQGRLAEVIREVRWVQPVEAGKRAAQLRAWLTPRQEARRALDRAAVEIEKLEQELRQARLSAQLQRFRRLRKQVDQLRPQLMHLWRTEEERRQRAEVAEHRRRAIDDLGRRQDELSVLIDELRVACLPDPELTSRVEESMGALSGRYSGVGDLGPRLAPIDDDDGKRRGRNIDTMDGRVLEALSTGQRLQMGVSLLLASNRIAEDKLPHRLVMIDDFGAGYDLSNLTREALLWRQIAFHPEPGQRRQVVLATHSGDLFRRLYDLLAPPTGCRVRVLSFLGWTANAGSEIDNGVLSGCAPPGGIPTVADLLREPHCA